MLIRKNGLYSAFSEKPRTILNRRTLFLLVLTAQLVPPYLAIQTLLQLFEDEGSKYPLGIIPMTESRYVDDIYAGADTEAETIEIAKQTQDLCAAVCFSLAKWASNNATLLTTMSPDDHTINSLREIGNTTMKVLGVRWNPHYDDFQFNYTLSE